MLSFLTLAACTAATPPFADPIAYIAEVDATYLYDATSAASADGWAVIQPAGTPTGRWKLLSDRIAIAPLGGGADDWPRLIGQAVPAMAKVGRAVMLRAGDWTCSSVISFPTDPVDLIGNAKVKITSTLTPNLSSPGIAPFLAQPGSVTSATTVAVVNTLGATQVQTAAAVAVGAILRLRNNVSGEGFHGSTYVVKACTGAGPYLVTVDRPVLTRFGVGDAAEVLPSQPTRIRILGNGMVVTGSGTRLLEFLPARHCLVADVQFLPTNVPDMICSFDLFGHHNAFLRCEGDGAGISSRAFALESQESSTTEVVACNCTGDGIAFFDCNNCQDRSLSHGNTNGISITADGNLIGSSNCRVEGYYNGNSGVGVGVQNGSINTRVVASARFNNRNVTIGDATSAVTGSFVSGAYTDGAGTKPIGISIFSTSVGSVLSGVDLSNCATGLSNQGAIVVAQGVAIRGAPTNAVLNAAGGRLVLSGFNVDTSGTIDVIKTVDAASRLDAAFGRVAGGSGSNLVRVGAGLGTVDHVVGTVSGGGRGVYADATATAHIGDAVDLTTGGPGTFTYNT